MLDVLLFESLYDLLASHLPELLLQSVRNLASDLLHDFHIGTLCHLSADFNKVSVVMSLLDLSLSDLLIEHLVIESLGVSIQEVVVQFSSVRLNHIRLPWRSAVGELVACPVAALPQIIMHNLLVSEGCVFEADQTFRWRGMLPERRRGYSCP